MRDEAIRRLEHQARVCEHLGSPLYASLLRAAALAAAGARATTAAPLAWVRFEPHGPDDPFAQAPFAVHVRTWPGGSEHRAATASPRGDDVDLDAAALASDPCAPPIAAPASCCSSPAPCSSSCGPSGCPSTRRR